MIMMLNFAVTVGNCTWELFIWPRFVENSYKYKLTNP